MPRLRPHPIESRKAKQAWAAAFLRNHGGASGKVVTFVCEPGLGVPELLRSLGHEVRLIDADVYEVDALK
jgi:hypothetical protein